VRIKRFRSEDEISDAANAVSVSKGLELYRKAIRKEGRSCSYSLETMGFYYGDNSQDRISLIETYGNGAEIYMLAPWSNRKRALLDTDAHAICTYIVHLGLIPFIGIWHFGGRVYEEPSFAIDHGISRAAVKHLLKKFKQKAAYHVTADRAQSVYLGQIK